MKITIYNLDQNSKNPFTYTLYGRNSITLSSFINKTKGFTGMAQIVIEDSKSDLEFSVDYDISLVPFFYFDIEDVLDVNYTEDEIMDYFEFLIYNDIDFLYQNIELPAKEFILKFGYKYGYISYEDLPGEIGILHYGQKYDEEKELEDILNSSFKLKHGIVL